MNSKKKKKIASFQENEVTNQCLVNSLLRRNRISKPYKFSLKNFKLPIKNKRLTILSSPTTTCRKWNTTKQLENCNIKNTSKS